MDILTEIGTTIFNLVQYMIMRITNLVKTCRGEETVYSQEEIDKVRP